MAGTLTGTDLDGVGFTGGDARSVLVLILVIGGRTGRRGGVSMRWREMEVDLWRIDAATGEVGWTSQTSAPIGTNRAPRPLCPSIRTHSAKAQSASSPRSKSALP